MGYGAVIVFFVVVVVMMAVHMVMRQCFGDSICGMIMEYCGMVMEYCGMMRCYSEKVVLCWSQW